MKYENPDANSGYRYSMTTRDVECSVRTTYLKDQSAPHENYFVWAYDILLRNNSRDTIQLLNRHWHIIDEEGNVQEVRGAGVIGKQPVLRPGEEFTYTSFTMLPTKRGSMVGSYEMETLSGDTFDVAIPEFDLQYPCRLVIDNETPPPV